MSGVFVFTKFGVLIHCSKNTARVCADFYIKWLVIATEGSEGSPAFRWLVKRASWVVLHVHAFSNDRFYSITK